MAAWPVRPEFTGWQMSGQDKTAAYGLAALVAGGVAAKAGLFTKLLAVLLAAKKLIFVGVIGIGALLSRLFKKNR